MERAKLNEDSEHTTKTSSDEAESNKVDQIQLRSGKVLPSPLKKYRFPVGGGPSSKTWPKCASQTAQRTSVLGMKIIDMSNLDFTSSGSYEKLDVTFGHSALIGIFLWKQRNTKFSTAPSLCLVYVDLIGVPEDVRPRTTPLSPYCRTSFARLRTISSRLLHFVVKKGRNEDVLLAVVRLCSFDDFPSRSERKLRHSYQERPLEPARGEGILLPFASFSASVAVRPRSFRTFLPSDRKLRFDREQRRSSPAMEETFFLPRAPPAPVDVRRHSFGPSWLPDFTPPTTFPSSRTGSYDILIGPNDRKLAGCKGNLLLPHASPALRRCSA
ncbi:hypothetical protein M5K25_024703 [Dendrobium thyrsiflorum]|uniref:Uncharacterized protein n=1 Tax=Dendrobium thyrsiflorum TaxID=117978 RepID=A0ABD0U2Y3_DENTH